MSPRSDGSQSHADSGTDDDDDEQEEEEDDSNEHDTEPNWEVRILEYSKVKVTMNQVAFDRKGQLVQSIEVFAEKDETEKENSAH